MTIIERIENLLMWRQGATVTSTDVSKILGIADNHARNELLEASRRQQLVRKRDYTQTTWAFQYALPEAV